MFQTERKREKKREKERKGARDKQRKKTEWEEIFWGFIESPGTVENVRQKCQAASTAAAVQAVKLV